ncbi:2-phosphoglycolate phosphatase [Neolentinus lepideus HHB14362 ss-1]|uniref:4-nitrophenylphosphatase n=1 Tax=Neolentinus lepideus HHB14362 ss-1 TaxID=1314782 RepID=A0A165T3J5_9AGAM|nr:2-phosphoglycolate phosphatase [Neolentinus lepideus HHB14362 ss-1]
MPPARLSTKLDYQSLLDKHDTWMFDCDGVLWNGDRLVDGAVKVLEILRSHNKSVLFVTNNATKSRPSYKKKFDKLGVEAHVDEIFGSAYAAAVYVSSVMKLPKDKKVYVVGMEGLEQELASEGISYIGGTDPADATLASFSLSSFTRDPAVAAVLCGLDTAINYTKLSKAFQYLQDPATTFLVTNDDSTYPAEGGLLPGAGAISAPLKTASGREPLSIGKPAKTMLDCIKAKHNFDPKRTIMVGDRLNTDILFGQNGGLSTLLVLTGITHIEDIEGPNASTIVPEYVTNSIGDLRILA